MRREVCGRWSVRCMSRLLFWLRRFRLSAQGWRLQRLVRMCLIAPSISFAEVQLALQAICQLKYL